MKGSHFRTPVTVSTRPQSAPDAGQQDVLLCHISSLFCLLPGLPVKGAGLLLVRVHPLQCAPGLVTSLAPALWPPAAASACQQSVAHCRIIAPFAHIHNICQTARVACWQPSTCAVPHLVSSCSMSHAAPLLRRLGKKCLWLPEAPGQHSS